jgi:hypothetical protein
MIPLIDYLRTLIGGALVASEAALLGTADMHAARLVRMHGVMHSKAVDEAVREMTLPEQCACAETHAAYYLGLQVGWRAAQRLKRS